jgi:hypothetical protein
MVPIEISLWLQPSGPEEIVEENNWGKAVSKKGGSYLCEFSVSGYSFGGYIILNAEYDGYATLYIPLQANNPDRKDAAAISDDEMRSLLLKNSPHAGSNWLINYFGANNNSPIGDYKIINYEDKVAGEKGIKITNINGKMNKVEPRPTKGKSLRMFSGNLTECLRIRLNRQEYVSLQPIIFPRESKFTI